MDRYTYTIKRNVEDWQPNYGGSVFYEGREFDTIRSASKAEALKAVEAVIDRHQESLCPEEGTILVMRVEGKCR